MSLPGLYNVVDESYFNTYFVHVLKLCPGIQRHQITKDKYNVGYFSRCSISVAKHPEHSHTLSCGAKTITKYITYDCTDNLHSVLAACEIT